MKIISSDWLAKSVEEDPASLKEGEGGGKAKKPNSSLERMGMGRRNI